MIRIYWRANEGSYRERNVLECAKEYKCEPNTHLFDLILADRNEVFALRKRKEAEIAELDARVAEERRKLHGGA